MSAAPLALFLTEFSRESKGGRKGAAPRAPAEEATAFEPDDADLDAIPEAFDAPDDFDVPALPAPGDTAFDEDLTEAEASSLDFEAGLDGDSSLEDEPAETPETPDVPEEDPALTALRAELEERHKAEIEALEAAHAAAMEEATQTARAGWTEEEGTRLAEGIASAVTEMRDLLAEKIADVLRPLMAGAVMARAKTELLETLDKLIDDATQPTLRVRASEDLLAVMQKARPDAAIEWQAGDSVEVTMIADGTRVETKLAAALADIAATEI